MPAYNLTTKLFICDFCGKEEVYVSHSEENLPPNWSLYELRFKLFYFLCGNGPNVFRSIPPAGWYGGEPRSIRSYVCGCTSPSEAIRRHEAALGTLKTLTKGWEVRVLSGE